MVKLPYSLLASRVSDIERMVDTSFSEADPMVAMTLGLIRSARHTLSLQPEGCWQDEMSDLIFHGLLLLTAGKGERQEIHAEASSRSLIRREAVSYILSNLDDPDLSVAVVADKLGVRMRTLQRAFFETGQTPRQIILIQRLDKAAGI